MDQKEYRCTQEEPTDTDKAMMAFLDKPDAPTPYVLKRWPYSDGHKWMRRAFLTIRSLVPVSRASR